MQLGSMTPVRAVIRCRTLTVIRCGEHRGRHSPFGTSPRFVFTRGWRAVTLPAAHEHNSWTPPDDVEEGEALAYDLSCHRGAEY